MNAFDWVPHVLPGGDDHGEREQDHAGDRPVQTEH